jgi:ATP-dependent DNA helicase RecQ
METSASSPPFSLDSVLAVVSKHWGFAGLRPLQEAAMRCVFERRDSLLVLPTGGGKSLCYQAPSVMRRDTTVVISPLISLMKDQVDGLRANGIPAAQLNSSLGPYDVREIEREVVEGRVRLLFASPERMATDGFRNLLKRVGVRTFAIDEAHCISHWGHDFRPDYRQLGELKELFPGASLHAFTATATEHVRRDIVTQLRLRDAEVLVGSFDRPNLTYRVVSREGVLKQACECLSRHPHEAGIIYCIRRRDVDELAADLKALGINALPYHAGLTPDQRRIAQEAFADEKCDLIVATVAFGMGIDRSNIRFVLHTGMPKSIEHYQQETGRAGRDGLEAECILLYSPGDVIIWRKIFEKSVEESETPVDEAWVQSSIRHIKDMDRYCGPTTCRHRALVEYFGQKYPAEMCGACDVCLGDREPHPDAQTIAKKILSCVYRVNQSFGVGHVVSVLRGENTEAIRQRGHDQLSTYGLLKEHPVRAVREWVHQLIAQQAIAQTIGDYPVLRLNDASWEIMKDTRTAKLFAMPERKKRRSDSSDTTKRSKADTESWEGVDREVFDALRELRRQFADQRAVPPYVIFSDATLRELARSRPSSLTQMHLVYGIGQTKLNEFGAAFLKRIDELCAARNLSRDVPRPPTAAFAATALGGGVVEFDGEPVAESRSTFAPTKRLNPIQLQADEMFRTDAMIEDVMLMLSRSRTTVNDYLCDFVRREQPASVAAWVDDETYRRIADAASRVGTERLKPIFVELGEQVPYDVIRIVVTHLAGGGSERSASV